MKETARHRSVEESSWSGDSGRAVRTTGRIKKAKIVFDPSDNYRPQNPRTAIKSLYNAHKKKSRSETLGEVRPSTVLRAVGSSGDNTCYICARKETKRNKQKLLACKDCSHKAHVACLSIEFEDLDVLRQKYRCVPCLICSSCYEGQEEADGMITCSKCVNSFHNGCHIPNMPKYAAKEKWKCSKCTIPKSRPPVRSLSEEPKPEVMNGVDDERATPLPTCSPSKMLRMSPKELHGISEVKSWSVDEVMNFFKKYFPEEAHVFRDHEIDGRSLLLLRRPDVVNKLSMKLGPALKIYNLILKVQVQSVDNTLAW